MSFDKIKVIFIDIDGTLVDDNKNISFKTKESIKRVVDKGIKVVITSGRDILHTTKKSKNANASSLVIASNGGQVVDYETNKTIFADYFNDEILSKVWDYCMKIEAAVIMKGANHVYCNKYNTIKDGYILIDDVSSVECGIAQFLIITNQSHKIDLIRIYIESLGLFVTSYYNGYLIDTSSGVCYIDVNNSDISKGTGVKKVLNYLNLDKENSMCFGDYINDIEMFKSCGYRVAMGNSCDEIKELADYVTRTNNEDGIAYFLDKYL